MNKDHVDLTLCEYSTGTMRYSKGTRKWRLPVDDFRKAQYREEDDGFYSILVSYWQRVLEDPWEVLRNLDGPNFQDDEVMKAGKDYEILLSLPNVTAGERRDGRLRILRAVQAKIEELKQDYIQLDASYKTHHSVSHSPASTSKLQLVSARDKYGHLLTPGVSMVRFCNSETPDLFLGLDHGDSPVIFRANSDAGFYAPHVWCVMCSQIVWLSDISFT